jgi:hypothetical protein
VDSGFVDIAELDERIFRTIRFTVEIADETGKMKMPGFRSLAAADEWLTEQMRGDAEIRQVARP